MENNDNHRPDPCTPAIDGKGATAKSAFLTHPIKSLTLLFWTWKLLLFLIIVICPGPGYDTSTTLLVPDAPKPSAQVTTDLFKKVVAWGPSASTILRFVRWDSIYFVRLAERGYLHEQEWAFGYGYTRLLAHLTAVLLRTNDKIGPAEIALVGVVVSHLSHFLSVLALYALSGNLFGIKTQSQKAFCFVSAALHITSPAGAFLSAPYGEPITSFLTFTGFYLYLSALFDEENGRHVLRDVKFIAAGVVFALTTTVRSNGILSGCLFAYDAVSGAAQVLTHGPSFDRMRRMSVIVLGGSIVALGMIGPQYIAFVRYCTDSATSRPWCGQLPPSIYGWVQAHYWNVGLFTYWTVSNLPLFFLAAPMLVVLCQSSLLGLQRRLGGQIWLDSGHDASSQNLRQSCLIRLAIPQGLLAVMALTSYHVQIINRISSAYPVWYWYLASLALDRANPSTIRKHIFAATTQGMVMYGLIQAVLFGSFLPPA